MVDDSEAVTIDFEEGEMMVTGGPTALADLAEQLLEFGVFNDLDEPGMHTHFVPEPNVARSVIATGSIPVVIYGPHEE